MRFTYQARNQEGQVKTGKVEAPNENAALEVLRKYGFFVTKLEKVKKAPLLSRQIKFFERIKEEDIVNLTKQLAIMFRSRVPLVDALRTLALQREKETFKKKILKISEEVEGGSSLSDAFSMYPELFSQFYVAMLKAGEASGNLSDSLTYLADHLERKHNLKSKMKGAATYPAFVVGMIFVILALMAYFVFPRLASVLEEVGRDLPTTTKMVLSGAEFIREWGWLLLLMLIGTIIGLFRFFKSRKGRKMWQTYALELPLIGDYFKKIYLSRFARNLSTLIKGGLPIAQALKITGEVVGNRVYKKIILETRDEVRKGEAINVVLSRYPDYIPPFVVQMVIVGEETGNLDDSLMNIVDFYQKEVERFADNLVNLMEPILIVILGLVVGFIVLTVFIPLYRINLGAM